MDQESINRTTSTDHSPKAKVIKRYGNRKLYDTARSSYVVLNDIAKMIRNEEEVQIIDNETKDDITSDTLTQIIFGAEKKSSCSAPLGLLKSIIKNGDGSFSNYLAEKGLFKGQIMDEKITIEENDNLKAGIKTGIYNPRPRINFQRKTLPERVVRAALSQNISSENEKTILPTSNGNLMKEE